jgi:hypothetical protein
MSVVDWIALLGAVTGISGVLLAGRREYLLGRRRMMVAPGANLTTSRVDPVGDILLGWACIAFWNSGGHDLSVERAGFQYLVQAPGEPEPHTTRAMIHLDSPLESRVDGPTQKIYTPLGPMLAAGVNPFAVLEAFVVTTGGREWFAPPQPLIQSVPPVSSADQLRTGLERIRDAADIPPMVGRELALAREKPQLID